MHFSFGMMMCRNRVLCPFSLYTQASSFAHRKKGKMGKKNYKKKKKTKNKYKKKTRNKNKNKNIKKGLF